MSRTNAIKLRDGVPIMRAELQYAVLNEIFNDEQSVFTDPFPTPGSTPRKLCFRELYTQAILKSPKSSKVLKDKMLQSPQFATDFAMLALLANTGRINTTMSFFPEMKTLIRTYHPIPALQKTNGSLQDAPRIKSILKACLMDSEVKSPPTTPAEILSRATSGLVPPTTAPNLIFVLSSFSPSVGRAHLSDDIEFVELFHPVSISSASRAKAFLWLCYHYLESSTSDSGKYDIGNSTGNPFCDLNRPGNAPSLVRLSDEDAVKENVDPEEDLAIRARLLEQRRQILKAQRTKGPPFGNDEDDDASEKRSNSSTKVASHQEKPGPSTDHTPPERSPVLKATDAPTSYPAPFPPSPPLRRLRRYRPYKAEQALTRPDKRKFKRTLLEQAWHMIHHSDPLLDSDNEYPDEHFYWDYTHRLGIISRLRGKEVTPDPE